MSPSLKMDKTKKSKKTPKPPQGRPMSTALISQSVTEDISGLFALSSFSSGGDLFAYLPLAVDKHRLRIYNTATGQAIADHSIDNALVSSMAWSSLELGEAEILEGSQPSKKKRKRKDILVTPSIRSKAVEAVILGLTDGSIVCFSPSHGRVLRTLSHPSSTTPVTALAVEECHRQSLIWASGQDATLRLWDVNKSEVVGSWKNDDRIPYTSLTTRYINGEDRTDILCASHTIRLLSRVGDAEGILPQKLSQVTTFTGHSSSVQSMKWIQSEPTLTRFVSMAETDRFLYVWDVPDSDGTDGKAVASIPLDSDARLFSLSDSTGSPHPPVLLATSGKIALCPIPHPISSLSRSATKLPTLHPRSIITPSSKKSSVPELIINASFIRGEPGKIHVARLVRGIRPVFTIISYLDNSGKFIEDLQLEDVPDIFPDETQSPFSNKRYNEAAIAVGSGIEPGHGENMDETSDRALDGDLQVDLAELSLGQRLATVADIGVHQASDSEDERISLTKSQSAKRRTETELNVVPANSLTRTLIQALHSSDNKLIETCLAHSNPELIRNTVRRLPSQLAIPLLNACVERLGRGARAANMKGGGAATSAQRGMTLITWIRAVLAVHTGHFMTLPDLVARLSGFHATLTARLALQESLLSLSGRLDMVLSQIEMRSSVAPAPLAQKNGKLSSVVRETMTKHYTEGESDVSDDDDAHMDVEVEIGDDEGSVEDVELGGDSEEDAEEGESEKDDDSDDSGTNQFVDDEAEEYSEEEEESE